MKYLTILPILLYIIGIWHKFGVQKSISESYYRLSWSCKPLFFFALLGTAFFISFTNAINNPSIFQNVILFLAAAGIGYTGAAAAFKDDKITQTVHYAGAMVGYFLGYAFIIIKLGFDSFYVVMPSAIIGFIIVKLDKRTWLWWLEVVGLVAIYLGTIFG